MNVYCISSIINVNIQLSNPFKSIPVPTWQYITQRPDTGSLHYTLNFVSMYIISYIIKAKSSLMSYVLMFVYIHSAS